jgi:large repetitive protein
VTQLSLVPLSAGSSTTYVQRAGGCTLPPGVSLNPSTGVVSGTPTATGTFDCFVDATVTNNGISWVNPAQVYIVVQ